MDPAVTQPCADVEELDRAECVRLLASTSLGRVAVNVPDWAPTIRPVNYLYDERTESVIMRSAPGSKLYGMIQSGKAAFEIDGIDSAARIGWSVIVVGATEEITNPSELRRLERLGLVSWAPGPTGHWMRIRARVVSGRRIARAAGQPVCEGADATPTAPSA